MRRSKRAEPIDHKRIRKITGSFSWIDHRFVTGGWIDLLSMNEILFYLWLVAVGDRNGVSFYSDEKTAARIKMSVDFICESRNGLIQKGLIVFKSGITQVLALPLPQGDLYA